MSLQPTAIEAVKSPKELLKDFCLQNDLVYTLIRTEILEILGYSPHSEIITRCNKYLDDVLGDKLHISFNKRIVLFYSEYMDDEILSILHNFFANRACNIENITLVTSTVGLRQFYQTFCNFHNTVGFVIHEIPMTDPDNYFLTDLSSELISKRISKHFACYGGSYEVDPPIRTFLCLLASQYSESSSIEMLSQVGDKQTLLNWLEYKSFFTNGNFVDRYRILYDENINEKYLDSQLRVSDACAASKDETFSCWGRQAQIDSMCLATLIRETVYFQQFNYISEKTFRCFYNECIPIFTDGPYIVEGLKSYGFWIDEDFFDYSYLQEKYFVDRIAGLENSLTKFCQKTLEELNSYYLNNLDNFQHNKILVKNWKNTIEQRINLLKPY